MTDSPAKGLRAGGALLAAFSLLLPWYVQSAHGLTGVGKSGLAALGSLSLLLVVLAVGAGVSATARIHRLLPSIAAGGLLLLVIVKIASPPAAEELTAGQGGDPIASAFG